MYKAEIKYKIQQHTTTTELPAPCDSTHIMRQG